ncbi:hypothetical protein CDAR_444841 [Caerostris darwini]|uniref:Uncharacterized protein n=1 Tax=Caerostris darwini TaxID=1538125 RepID=A0AAV4NTD8_9ARAC|nr:hypothetical protein CDAR_444841 [Caerostris darwini]
MRHYRILQSIRTTSFLSIVSFFRKGSKEDLRDKMGDKMVLKSDKMRENPSSEMEIIDLKRLLQKNELNVDFYFVRGILETISIILDDQARKRTKGAQTRTMVVQTKGAKRIMEARTTKGIRGKKT